MPFTDDTLKSNCWCSIYDCKKYLWDIDKHLKQELDILDSAIETTSSQAKAVLRKRYGDNMPFSESSPPKDVRVHIATCASYMAVRSMAFSTGSHEGLLDALRQECKTSKEYFNDIAEGVISFDFTSTDIHKPSVTPAPNSAYGFDNR